MTREEAYDEHIAPTMARVIAACKEHRIPMHADFQLDGEMRCTTHLSQPGDGALWRMYLYLSKAGDNIDSFLMAVIKDARRRGHSSVLLHLLNVDLEP